MAKKMALGKGIGALINSGSVNPNVVNKAKEMMDLETAKNNGPIEPIGPMLVPVEKIKTNPNQPRKIFKEEEIAELSQSIKENGVIQPLIVAEMDGNYELIAGERRLRASKLAGLPSVPVVVKRATDREKVVMAIIENVQRSDLNCVEEALAYFQLMEDYKLTQEEVAKKIGKERSTIANFLRILKLPREVVDMIQKDLLSFGHAKVLASIKDREKCIRVANEVVTNKLSVRDTEKLSKKTFKVKEEKKNDNNDYFGEKLDQYRQKLEQRTGYHFNLKSNKKGGGQVILNFSNEAEFNDIYEFLLQK
ncbi:MAG: chromosome partitioning protein ParB [Halobacteriovorax sp.]|nr:chromosome partitioning protein ParB [Halobacteriovorax sp.]MEE3079823.1 ParB/RepB/Spo0J family partition protein [Bdellovibrionota bacterium]